MPGAAFSCLTHEAPLCYEALLPKADVAQMVEQLIRNHQVSGSIPLVGSSKHKGLAGKWLGPFLLAGGLVPL